MKIKTLIENTENGEICAEHGLCFYVEYRNKRYLIDSGASNLFVTNADKTGVDLDSIDTAFLSHAHYDHSGGYSAFFERNNHAKVYLQKAAENRECFKITDSVKKDIGIPDNILVKNSDRFIFVDGEAKIDDGIFIVPHSSEKIRERSEHTNMFTFFDGKMQPDDFKHEQTIVFEETDGLVCFNSCSHSGVDIAVDEVKNAFPGKKIKAYIGGFHLMGADGIFSCGYTEEEVKAVAKKLVNSNVKRFYSGHCTGIIAFSWLKEILGDKLTQLYSGKVFEI